MSKKNEKGMGFVHINLPTSINYTEGVEIDSQGRIKVIDKDKNNSISEKSDALSFDYKNRKSGDNFSLSDNNQSINSNKKLVKALRNISGFSGKKRTRSDIITLPYAVKQWRKDITEMTAPVSREIDDKTISGENDSSHNLLASLHESVSRVFPGVDFSSVQSLLIRHGKKHSNCEKENNGVEADFDDGKGDESGDDEDNNISGEEEEEEQRVSLPNIAAPIGERASLLPPPYYDTKSLEIKELISGGGTSLLPSITMAMNHKISGACKFKWVDHDGVTSTGIVPKIASKSGNKSPEGEVGDKDDEDDEGEDHDLNSPYASCNRKYTVEYTSLTSEEQEVFDALLHEWKFSGRNKVKDDSDPFSGSGGRGDFGNKFGKAGKSLNNPADGNSGNGNINPQASFLDIEDECTRLLREAEEALAS